MLKKELKFFLIFGLLLLIPYLGQADSTGQTEIFYVEPEYDHKSREQISATLQQKGTHLYFYLDDQWWSSLTYSEKTKIKSSLSSLSQFFNNEIYPVLTNTFGSEWNPGIDNDSHATVLIHPMKNGARGYYREADEFYIFEIPESNQREMLYLTTTDLTKDIAKSYLAHEFQHLITFNIKNRIRGVEEDVWIYEMFSEYAPSLVGYDNPYSGSNLESRINTFLQNPSDSLTEWTGKASDYGVLNIFTQYLVDHYGVNVLVDALNSPYSGIESIDYGLSKSGHSKKFSEIFEDWAITVLINDCSLGENFCYKNSYLSSLRIVPSLNFLPYAEKTSLTIEDSVKDWSGNWYKLVGGKGGLQLNFDGVDRTDFKVMYYACKISGTCHLSVLSLNNKQEATLTLSDFEQEYSSLTLIVLTQDKKSRFGSSENPRSFSLKATTLKQEENIEALLAQIAWLQEQIAMLQEQLTAILGGSSSCSTINQNLSYGMNSNQVKCLQQFLKSQGAEIYPQGLTTGYFGSLTHEAVIKFQEKYRSEILDPLDLESGTGYVGSSTRMKINSLIGQ